MRSWAGAALRRWLNDGVIRADQSPNGPIAETKLLPLSDGGEKASAKAASPENEKSLERAASPRISRC